VTDALALASKTRLVKKKSQKRRDSRYKRIPNIEARYAESPIDRHFPPKMIHIYGHERRLALLGKKSGNSVILDDCVWSQLGYAANRSAIPGTDSVYHPPI